MTSAAGAASGRRRTRAWLLGAAALGGIALLAPLAPTAPPSQWMDLQVYQGAIRSMLDGHGLYSYVFPDPLNDPAPFLYPPFAALVLLPSVLLSAGSAGIVWAVLQLGMAALLVLALARTTGWWPSGSAIDQVVKPAVLGVLFIASRPVVSAISLGQVSLLIVTLCVVDMLVLPPRWRGTLIGLAGGLKLTPLLFLPFFVVTRQWRAAVNAGASFLAATVLGFILLPTESVQYWTSVVFATDRVPNLGSQHNLAILGEVKAWHVPELWQRPAWLALAAVIAGFALMRARQQHRRGDDAAATITIGGAAAVAGAVAWPHAMLWVVLAAVYLVFTGGPWTRRGGWLLLVLTLSPSPLWPRDNQDWLWQLVGTIPLLLVAAFSIFGLPKRTGTQSASPARARARGETGGVTRG